MTPAEQRLAQDYRETLAGDVQNEFRENGTTAEQAFAEIAVDRMTEAEILDDFNPVYHDSSVGTGRRKTARINGYYFSPLDKFMNLFLVHYSGETEAQKLGRPDVDRLLSWVRNFVSYRETIKEELDWASPCRDCIDELDEHLIHEEQRVKKFRFFLLTNEFVTDQALRIQLEPLDGIPVEAHVFDISRLATLAVGGDSSIVQIDFSTYTSRIPCIPVSEAADSTLPYKSYIGFVPGVVLADIYDEFGASLFEGNVRSFLGWRKVNKAIRETALRKPASFFAFNNGIAVTASNIRIDDQGCLAYAEDFQIVNGGQTTVALATARRGRGEKADLSKIRVLMKLTELNPGMDELARHELLKTISKASNTQNKVDDADFFSTHPFHVRFEEWSQQTPAPPLPGSILQTYWFYERARGSYGQRQLGLTPKEVRAYKQKYPQKQKITKLHLAKCWESWEEKPWLVSKGGVESFKVFAREIEKTWETESEREKYNRDYFKKSIALIILFNEAVNLVAHQPWYTGSFRAQIVTYSIALFHHVIRQMFPGMEFNFNSIWQRQGMPEAIKRAFEDLSGFVYRTITENAGVNVTQLCKKEKECWEDMLHRTLPELNRDELSGFMMSQAESDARTREARNEQQVLSGANLQEWVYAKGSDFWARLQTFALDAQIPMLPKEESALTTALRMETTGRLPPPFACKLLQGLLRRCQENGFNEE